VDDVICAYNRTVKSDINRVYCILKMTHQEHYQGESLMPTISLLSHLLSYHLCIVHCVSKNDTDVAHYNFNTHQPILVILAEMLLTE